jgi:hypothetical protein
MVGGVPLGGVVDPLSGALVLPGVGFAGAGSGVGFVGVVSGVGLAGAVSGVVVEFGVVSGVGVVGVVSGVVASGEAGFPDSGVAVPGVGAAVPGVGAAVPGAGASVPGAVLGVWLGVPVWGDALGVEVCGAGAAVCAATQIAVNRMPEVNRALNFMSVSPPIQFWSSYPAL